MNSDFGMYRTRQPLNREAGVIIHVDPETGRERGRTRLLYCVHCVGGDSKIVTTQGVLDISKIRPGHQVVDASGKFVDVSQLHARTVPSTIRFTMRGGGEPLVVSPSHPVMAMDATYVLHKGRRTGEFVPQNNPTFKRAEAIKPGMWLAVGKLTEQATPQDFCGINFDTDLARFIGLYLAEGAIGRDRVEFGFNKSETQYIEFVRQFARQRWGVNCSFEDRKNSQSCKVLVNSSKLEEAFLATFGKYAVGKCMPAALLGYPEKLQASMMGGLLDGDGTFAKDRPQRSLKTISPHLAYQSSLVLRRLGYHPSVTSSPAYVSKAGVNHQKAYQVSFSIPSDHRKRFVRRHFVHDGQVWVKVMKKEVHESPARVFNLTTQTGSFVANGFVTHNCGNHFPDPKQKRSFLTHAAMPPGTMNNPFPGFCQRCNGFHCGSTGCCECKPVERLLDEMEGTVSITAASVPVTAGVWTPTEMTTA